MRMWKILSIRWVRYPSWTMSISSCRDTWNRPRNRIFFIFRDYVKALRERVLAEMVTGATIEEILERVTMEDFSDYENFDTWLHSNVIPCGTTCTAGGSPTTTMPLEITRMPTRSVSDR